MSEIRIPVPIVLLAIVGAIVAVVVAQLPEIQRYLKVKAM
jgi:Family of unknown function (DUF6893)